MAIFKTITDTISKFSGDALFALQENSPELFLILGIGGVLVGTGFACKAVLDSKKIVDETKPEIKEIPETIEEVEVEEDSETITEEQLPEVIDRVKKHNRKVYLKTALKVAKKWIPALLIMGLSIASILESNHIMKERNIGLAAAYAAVDGAYKAYRARVVDKFGEDIDTELAYGTTKNTIEKTIVDENGEKKTVKETVYLTDYPEFGPYAVNFTEESDFCEESDTVNNFILNDAQTYFNAILQIKKAVSLNEVLDRVLGPTRGNPKLRKAGMVVGWLYDPENGQGDNSIKFKVFHVNRENKFGVMEEQIIIDFNCDGTIYNRI